MVNDIHHKISTFAIILLLTVAILFYSAATATTLMFLEIAGALLLSSHFWQYGFFSTPHKPAAIFVWASLGLALVYLLPLPADWWTLLPGRELYTDAVIWINAQGFSAETRLSLIPDETNIALLFLIPVLAVFLVTSTLPAKYIGNLVMVFLVLAAFEAALGLIQYTSHNPAFFFGIAPHGQSAQGTYLNPDHFAALMEMALPLAIGLTLYSAGQKPQHEDSLQKLHGAIIFGGLATLILLGGIFSRSRSGVFLVIVSVLLSTIIFARHLGGKQSASITSVFSTIAGGFAVSIGLVPVLMRFVAEDPLADGRWEIYRHTITGINTFFPLGAGPGTFPDIYRKFQPIDQLYFINHAHNDYLELIFEMGLGGVIIIATFIALYFYGWIRLWNRPWDATHFIQVGAGIAVLLIMLHSMVDFNLHNAANAVSFGFVTGLFFRKTPSRQ